MLSDNIEPVVVTPAVNDPTQTYIVPFASTSGPSNYSGFSFSDTINALSNLVGSGVKAYTQTALLKTNIQRANYGLPPVGYQQQQIAPAPVAQSGIPSWIWIVGALVGLYLIAEK